MDFHSDRSAFYPTDFWSIPCNRRAWRKEGQSGGIGLYSAGSDRRAGFTGGIGILLRNTGGYIIGFLFSALVMWAMEALFGKKTWVLALSMVVGLAVCYTFGTAWFMMVYAKDAGAIGVATALGWCVFPFVIPDLIKIALAMALSKRMAAMMKVQ